MVLKRRLLRIAAWVIAFNLAMVAVSLLLRRLIPSSGNEESDEIALAAVFGGIDLSSHAPAFRGGSAQAIMGGLQLDLRGARLDPAGARLEVRAVMGGIELIVPDEWRLVVSNRSTLGGVSFPQAATTDPDAEADLVVDCRAIFGGIDIAARAAEPEPSEVVVAQA
jgi:predicted membrane protein